MKGIVAATVGALVLGVLSALGDWVWARYIPDGAVLPGIVHGVVVFFVIAWVLARATGRRSAYRFLLLWLPLAGALIAGSFYPLYYVLGYVGSLLVTWAAMWLVTAWLQRKARGDVERLARTVLRGGLAALCSGLAFWAVSGMWTGSPPLGLDGYGWRVAFWSFAFWPGFLALLVGQEAIDRR